MASHSSILAWKILCTEEPGRLKFMEMQRVRHDWATNTLVQMCLCLYVCAHMHMYLFFACLCTHARC